MIKVHRLIESDDLLDKETYLRDEIKGAIQEKLDKAIRDHFKAKFISRINKDHIIVFDPLTKKFLNEILDIKLKIVNKLLAAQGIGPLELSPKLRDKVIEEGFDIVNGARPLLRALKRIVLNPLADEILKKKFQPGESIAGSLDEAGEVLFTSTLTEEGDRADELSDLRVQLSQLKRTVSLVTSPVEVETSSDEPRAPPAELKPDASIKIGDGRVQQIKATVGSNNSVEITKRFKKDIIKVEHWDYPYDSSIIFVKIVFDNNSTSLYTLNLNTKELIWIDNSRSKMEFYLLEDGTFLLKGMNKDMTKNGGVVRLFNLGGRLLDEITGTIQQVKEIEGDYRILYLDAGGVSQSRRFISTKKLPKRDKSNDVSIVTSYIEKTLILNITFPEGETPNINPVKEVPLTPKEQLFVEFTHQQRDRILETTLYTNPVNPKIVFMKAKHIDEREKRNFEYKYGMLYQINLETNLVFSVGPGFDMEFYENSYFAVPSAKGGYAVVTGDVLEFYDAKGEKVDSKLLSFARNTIRIYPLADGGYAVSYKDGEEWNVRTYSDSGEIIGVQVVFKGPIVSVTPFKHGGCVVIYEEKKKKKFQIIDSKGKRIVGAKRVNWELGDGFFFKNGGYLLDEVEDSKAVLQLYDPSGSKVEGYRNVSDSPRWKDIKVEIFDNGTYAVTYKDQEGKSKIQRYTLPNFEPFTEKVFEPKIEVNFEGNTFHIKSNYRSC